MDLAINVYLMIIVKRIILSLMAVLKIILTPFLEVVWEIWVHIVKHHSYYNHTYRPKELKALIFNHEEFDSILKLKKRDGSNADVKRLDSVLKRVGFQVSHHMNESAENIKKIIRDQSQNRSNAVFVFILTHGNYGNLAANDKMYDPNDIFNAFPVAGRFSWQIQPKVVFIQACQNVTQNEPIDPE